MAVKVEVVLGVVAANRVKGEATFLLVRKEVELAVRGGGARVPRPVGQGNPILTGCFCCGDKGHVQGFCLKRGAVAIRGGRAGRCWGCGGVGHHLATCPVRSLPMAGADGSFSRGLFRGSVKRGGGGLAGMPASKGGPLRGSSVLEYVNESRAPVGGARLGAH